MIQSFFFFRLLFITVAAFLICSIPRTILNFAEMFNMIELYYLKYFMPEVEVQDINCQNPPLWAYILRHVSSLLMALDASLGFLIYSIACKQFRGELKTLFQSIWKKIKNICGQEVIV